MSDQIQRRRLQRAKASGSYLHFYRDYIYLFSGSSRRNKALFLQDLWNHWAGSHTEKDADDYFLCSTTFLQNSLDWDPDLQSTYLAELEEIGFIRTKKVGMPARRWVYIDVDAIEEALDEYEKRASPVTGFPQDKSTVFTVDQSTVNTPRKSNPPNGGLQSKQKEGGASPPTAACPPPPDTKPSNSNGKAGNGSNHHPGSGQRLSSGNGKGKITIEEPSSAGTVNPYSKQASDLRRAIRARGWHATKASIDTNAEPLRLLHQQDGIPVEESQGVIDWLLDPACTVTNPDIRNGQQFRQHFRWLRDNCHKDRGWRYRLEVVEGPTKEERVELGDGLFTIKLVKSANEIRVRQCYIAHGDGKGHWEDEE